MFTGQLLLKHKYTDNVTDSVFFILWNVLFLLVLALDSNGIINTLKGYYVALECTDLVAFTFATWEIRLCLLCKLISPCQKRPSWIYLLLWVSLVSKVKWSELFGYFIATSSEIGKMIKYLQAKRRTFRKCKDYVISREITTVLNTAVDNAILE